MYSGRKGKTNTEWRYSIQIFHVDSPTFHLEDLTNKKERGKGVGKALYTAFIEYAEGHCASCRVGSLGLEYPCYDFDKGSGAKILEDYEPFKWIQQRCDTI